MGAREWIWILLPPFSCLFESRYLLWGLSDTEVHQDSAALRRLWGGTCNFVTPTGEDVVGHFMGFIGFHVLGDSLRGREPGWGGGFAEMRVLGRAEKGAEGHGELIAMAVVIGNGFGAYFVSGSFELDGVEDFGGIDE